MKLRKDSDLFFVKGSAAFTLLYAFLGTTLLFFMSQLSIPLSPVPITLQTVAVMLMGLTFERKAALGAIGAYLSLGAVGFPVFSSFSGGFPVLVGPTGGYLFGFLPAVFLMTFVREKINHNHVWVSAINCLVGTAVIFVCGITWLSTFLGFEKAILAGFVPFIVPGLLKIGLLMGFLYFLKKPQNL